MKTKFQIYLALALAALGVQNGLAQGAGPFPATQTQVNAGTLSAGYYVDPLTLKNWTGGSGGVTSPISAQLASLSFSNLLVPIGGNLALQNAGTASTNFGGYLQIGTLANSNNYGYPGNSQLGYLVGTGMNQFPGGFTGPVDTVSAWWKQMENVITTSNSQMTMINFGDSFGEQVWQTVIPQMQNAIGFAGVGGADVTVTLSGTASTSNPLTQFGDYAYNPTGVIETLTATNDSVIYSVNGNSNGMADTLRIFYAKQANGGTFKVQTASASPPAYSFGGFSDEAGFTAVSTSGSPTTTSISLLKTPGYAWQIKLIQTVSNSAGTIINFRPAFYTSSASGVQTYNLSAGGISLSDSNTVSTAYLAPFLAAINPSLISYHMSEGNTYLGTALETMRTLWSTSDSTTTWFIMDNPPNGTNGGAANSNPTTAQELQNTFLSNFAQAHGYQFYDIYGFARNWAWVDNVLGLGGDGTHLDAKFFSFVGTKLVRDMGITALNTGLPPAVAGSNPTGPAIPQSLYGPSVTVTGTTAFTLNPLGVTVPNYYTFRLQTDHDQGYSHDNAVFDVRNALILANEAGTGMLTLTTSGTMAGTLQVGAAGSGYQFDAPASTGHSEYIELNQQNGSLGIINGNGDAGLLIRRGTGADTNFISYALNSTSGSFTFLLGNGTTTSSTTVGIWDVTNMEFQMNTDATASNSAAVWTDGGIAAKKSAWIGNALHVGGATNLLGPTTVSSTLTAASGLIVASGSASFAQTLSSAAGKFLVDIGGNVTVTQTVSMTGTNIFEPNILNSGATNFMGTQGGNNQQTELLVADAAALLGVSSLYDSARGKDTLLKINIRNFQGGLDFARRINARVFDWAPGNSYGYKPWVDEIGFVADEVDKELPLAVNHSGRDPSLRDRALIAVAFNAIKELDALTLRHNLELLGLLLLSSVLGGHSWHLHRKVKGLSNRKP